MFSWVHSFDYWLNRKNCCVPEMGLVTVFCPLTMTALGETLPQTADETRFVVDCKIYSAVLAGQVKITLVPDGMIVSCGGGNLRLKSVPSPGARKPPPGPYSPWYAVP